MAAAAEGRHQGKFYFDFPELNDFVPKDQLFLRSGSVSIHDESARKLETYIKNELKQHGYTVSHVNCIMHPDPRKHINE